jgi:hypothetical protein
MGCPSPRRAGTTDKLVRGGSEVAGADIERNGGTRAPQMTPSSAATTYTEQHGC